MAKKRPNIQGTLTGQGTDHYLGKESGAFSDTTPTLQTEKLDDDITAPDEEQPAETSQATSPEAEPSLAEEMVEADEKSADSQIEDIEDEESFNLTSQALRKLKKAGLPREVLTTLRSLKDRRFTEHKKFWTAVARKVGKENASQYQALILKHAKEGPIADTIYFSPKIYRQLREEWMRRKISDPAVRKWHIVNEALEAYFEQQS